MYIYRDEVLYIIIDRCASTFINTLIIGMNTRHESSEPYAPRERIIYLLFASNDVRECIYVRTYIRRYSVRTLATLM